ncbi:MULTISPECIES: UDP-N-acetylglucosamine--undecaprenyl-phosphate N-acetylglucosaminephosphotransferase [Shewanella]|uniref:UDP-N-acetylglucosamine--undecaprenyl-phosphate N-acetylglucosaminephosphotransferase n=1 Tax=Shewanella TaxID=22 RepID=UPI000C59053E|nr:MULTISPECIES: UDP-N-acetylglucosamine--undecaprenyl-phosphate N-acetylglucosaminephosphotransferase [Shewanella]NCQ44525.1 UDP-N-acetylglucosamine--undecaprenyl-phosphate N-acetylglucosaminephosphotransferase [Shewanella frigidimarina]NCO72188.1 UDP-N-acetylglucosamine--undecaprenyl-phosphate N-acetylglucosaminephosphotransferase [Shewanella vesiculosa]NCP35868.1 UDP-N-acetylglucosamine--undecaprenyl-phosphate N-acetylglucosaminephosphotransferase [Shewanella vesiculosa]NCP68745.1 UDP-N-acet
MSTSTSIIFVFCLSFISLFVFRKLAKRFGLVDKPNERKHHVGQIPLVGGISIYCTLMIALFVLFPITNTLLLYVACSTVLIVLGALDDRYDLSFKSRLVVQAGISLAMILIGYKSLHYLGAMFSDSALVIPTYMSYIVTILAVIGAINAFNMVDGIDGLLGGLASVTFSALGLMFYLAGNIELATFCLLFVGAMLPYIMLNLGFPFGRRFKVFMGDAGSMFIGFTAIWLLIEASQGGNVLVIRPVTALWFIALPLMDMVCIMTRRLKKGQSPFKPDREHLHHICQRIGLSSSLSLLVICLLASIMAGVGILSELYNVPESIMFFSFLVTFAIYFSVIANIWRITAFLHKTFTFTQPSHE